MFFRCWRKCGNKAKKNFAVTMAGGSGDIKQERHKTELSLMGCFNFL